jgi:hypothetical protein
VAIGLLNRSRGTGGLSFYDFSLGVLPAGTAFSRASTGWYFNGTGTLVPAANDAPRFAYDPSSLAPRGILIEGPVTNGIRNNSMAGAVVGSPGSPPTNWAGLSGLGVTGSVVATGTVNGIPSIDIRYTGTPTATGAIGIRPETVLGIAAATAQKWLTSWYVALIAGGSGFSLPRLNLSEFNSAGSFVAQSEAAISLTGTLARFSYLGTLSGGASTAYVAPVLFFGVTNGTPIDATLRIGAPDCAQIASGPTSPILTSAAAGARMADVCTITDGTPLANTVYVVKARTAPFYPDDRQTLIRCDDGTNNNCRVLQRQADGSIHMQSIVGGVVQLDISAGIVANDTDFTIAARWGDGNFSVSLNGGAVVKQTFGTNPVGLTTFRLGRPVTGGLAWNSTIRTIRTLAAASDSDLQSLST